MWETPKPRDFKEDKRPKRKALRLLHCLGGKARIWALLGLTGCIVKINSVLLFLIFNVDTRIL